jgi:hypothetical protein
MRNGTAKWLSMIVLAVIAGYFGVWALVYVYVSFASLNWMPGLHQVHPLVWAGTLLASIALLYLSYISLKSAKRGGEWRWR